MFEIHFSRACSPANNISNLCTPNNQYRSIQKSAITFFTEIPLEQGRDYINYLLAYSYAEQRWKYRRYIEIIDFCFALKELIKALCFLLPVKEPQSTEEPDITNLHTYYPPNATCEAWKYFPQFLDMQEFTDPALAIDKLFTFAHYEKWENILQELQYYALSPSSITEKKAYQSLQPDLYKHLNKLVEATHLLWVRIGCCLNELPG